MSPSEASTAGALELPDGGPISRATNERLARIGDIYQEYAEGESGGAFGGLGSLLLLGISNVARSSVLACAVAALEGGVDPAVAFDAADARVERVKKAAEDIRSAKR